MACMCWLNRFLLWCAKQLSNFSLQQFIFMCQYLFIWFINNAFLFVISKVGILTPKLWFRTLLIYKRPRLALLITGYPGQGSFRIRFPGFPAYCGSFLLLTSQASNSSAQSVNRQHGSSRRPIRCARPQEDSSSK